MISAKIVADSLSPQGHRLTTLEVVMPRYILAEFNTHRVLSKNSASSRAIPFSKMVKEIQENPFIPYAWQKDHSGMQGNEYFTEQEDIKSAEEEWLMARNLAMQQAYHLNENIKVTKQLVNRLLEPFMYHKVLVSGTEWENFFNLRCPQYNFKATNHNINFKSKLDYIKHNEIVATTEGGDNAWVQPKYDDTLGWLQLNKGQADIHMMFLAEAIYDAIQESTPRQLEEGQWHIPYGDNMDNETLLKVGYKLDMLIKDQHLKNISDVEAMNNDIQQLKTKVSVARCARLSYQTLGDNPVINYEKDLELYKVLSTSGHWSPFEHVARAMTEEEYSKNYIASTSTKSRATKQEGKWQYADLGWCRNFRGFIQQRTLLD